MSDVELGSGKSKEQIGDESLEHVAVVETSKNILINLLRRFVLLISFGPGVLGFLWLIGRILRR